MATYTLSGSGVQALSAGVTALHVTISTLPPGAGDGSANPQNYYDVGLLRLGDASGFFEPTPVVGGPQWIAVPTGSTQLGYTVTSGGVISVAEVLGGVPPFGYVAPAAAPPGATHVPAMAFNVTLPVSSAMTTLKSYTVPAGRSALVEAMYLGVGLTNTTATVIIQILLAGDYLYYNNLTGPLPAPYTIGYWPTMQGVGQLHMNAGESLVLQAENLNATQQVGTIGSVLILEYPQAMW